LADQIRALEDLVSMAKRYDCDISRPATDDRAAVQWTYLAYLGGGQGSKRRPALTWKNFFIGNLLAVTIGNLIGGSLMVAAVYWFIYLRKTAS
jgi:hypothetical protein